MVNVHERRKWILIVCVILFLLFLWLIFMLLNKKSQPTNESIAETKTDVTPEIVSPYTLTQLQQEKEERAQSSSITTLAKTFVERYGSYSNEANYQNIRDVLPLMTSTFAEATEKELATKTIPKGFYGMTTHSISVKIVTQDEETGTANVLVSTQRIEENGSAQNQLIKYQEIELSFMKEAGVWKVDSATWR